MYAIEEWEEEEDVDEIEELEHELGKQFDEIDQLDIKLGRTPTYQKKYDPRDLAKEIYHSAKNQKLKRLLNHMPPPKEDAPKKPLFISHNRTVSLPLQQFLDRQVKKKKEPQILSEIEALNIDIPENREKFRAHFGGINKSIKQKDTDTQKEHQRYLDDEETTENDEAENEDQSQMNLMTSLKNEL
jgi:hypothetical protein